MSMPLRRELFGHESSLFADNDEGSPGSDRELHSQVGLTSARQKVPDFEPLRSAETIEAFKAHAKAILRSNRDHFVSVEAIARQRFASNDAADQKLLRLIADIGRLIGKVPERHLDTFLSRAFRTHNPKVAIPIDERRRRQSPVG